MPDIQVLPQHVSDMIAAGEVVERPASVAKELIENAIDAGARSVTVEIRHGGVSYLRVTDDGCGIAADQAVTAFLRHATSKIRTENDLEAIATLGFRGEALAAIGAVAHVEMLTKPKEAPVGYTVMLEGGKVIHQGEAGCPDGTTVVVRSLFFNLPARYKFLKRDAAEGAAVNGVVQREALAHPEVAFRFIRDGVQELSTPGDDVLQNAIYAVLGREFAKDAVLISGSSEGASVTGYITRPTACRGSRNWQYFFLNGRWIRSKLVTAALENAYRNQKMVGKFPGGVLHIAAKYSSVDVNSHPTKTEVKFVREKDIYDAVYYAVLTALGGEDDRPVLRLDRYGIALPEEKTGAARDPDRLVFRSPAPEYRYTAEPGAGPIRSGPIQPEEEPSPLPEEVPGWGWATKVYEPVSSQRDFKAPQSGFDPPPVSDHSEHTFESPDPLPGPAEAIPGPEDTAGAQTALEEPGELPWRLVGEVLNTYIIVEQGDEILFIDKHAAHERMNFDALKAQGFRAMSQELLAPVVFRPGPEEGEVLLEHRALLEEFGFALADYGGGQLTVSRVPEAVTPEEAPEALSELAGKLLSTGSLDPGSQRDELMHTMACKAAIKGGQRNDPAELERVARAVLSGEVKHCPHGRPVATHITRAQLERQFKRS